MKNGKIGSQGTRYHLKESEKVAEWLNIQPVCSSLEERLMAIKLTKDSQIPSTPKVNYNSGNWERSQAEADEMDTESSTVTQEPQSGNCKQNKAEA